ncbi:hypothetical protein Tco_0446294 [Tanacetum coccineum]
MGSLDRLAIDGPSLETPLLSSELSEIITKVAKVANRELLVLGISGELRYWRHNSVPHCIDFVHVEKNVCESLVRTLLNVPGKTKDGMNARLDLAELGIKPELFARQEEDKTTLPPAGYTLTNAEKDIFCETLSNIRVPQGYCSNFSSLVSLKDRKLIGLKSHDYHMIIDVR